MPKVTDPLDERYWGQFAAGLATMDEVKACPAGAAAEITRLREVLREIAVTEFCHEDSWRDRSVLGPDEYLVRNTCCIEKEPDKEKWCIQCLAASALGWDRTEYIRQAAGETFLEPSERASP